MKTVTSNPVQTLRQNGYRVTVSHIRKDLKTGVFAPRSVIPAQDVGPCGGMTYVRITTPEGAEYFACTKCRENENYNKKLGVKMAIGRALNLFS
jgi:hypothetical protein